MGKAATYAARHWRHPVLPDLPLNGGIRVLLLQPGDKHFSFNRLSCAQTALSGRMCFTTLAPCLITSDFLVLGIFMRPTSLDTSAPGGRYILPKFNAKIHICLGGAGLSESPPLLGLRPWSTLAMRRAWGNYITSPNAMSSVSAPTSVADLWVQVSTGEHQLRDAK